MKVTLIGCGCGSLTEEAQDAISRAELVLGSGRMLRQVGEGKRTEEAVTAAAVLEAISAAAGDAGIREVCVLLSGDSGFYSGAKQILQVLEESGQPWAASCEVQVLPGISSLQILSARLKRPWQDWKLCSAHGVDCDAVSAVCEGKPVFFLTGGKQGPAELCRELQGAGLDFLRVTAGENLGTEQEQILNGTAGEFAGMEFAPLSVLLAEAAPRPVRRTPGLPDISFLREEKIPMTKQVVRVAALAKLGVGPKDICWDIGAGTGSVSIELALQSKAVCAVERNERALRLAEENRRKLGAWNLRLIHGEAPDALEGLPKPDAVFVGGSGGRLREILQAVDRANPEAGICVSAIALETLYAALEELCRLGYETEVSQIAVSHSKNAGDLTLMLAENPVWLIAGWKP